MRTYLMQSSSALIELVKTAVRNWIDLLTIEFTSKGILHDFTIGCIPATKKKLNVNGTEIKDKDTNDAVKKQWLDLPKQNAAEKKLKSKLKAIVIRKAKDTANKDLEIYKDPEIIEACKEGGHKA